MPKGNHKARHTKFPRTAPPPLLLQLPPPPLQLLLPPPPPADAAAPGHLPGLRATPLLHRRCCA